MPKNESLGLLRDAQAGATNGQMRQRAGQKAGEVGKSFMTATDALYNAIRPPEPYQVVGVGKDGSPLYKNPLGFGPAVSRQEYDRISGGTGYARAEIPNPLDAMAEMEVGLRKKLGFSPKPNPVIGYDPQGNPQYKSVIPFAGPIDESRYQAEQIAMRGLPMSGSGMRSAVKGLVDHWNRKSQPIRSRNPSAQELQPDSSNFSSSSNLAAPRLTPQPASSPRPTAEVLPPDPSIFNRGPGRIVDPLPRPTAGLPSPTPTPMPGPQAIPKDPFAGFGQQFANIEYGPNFKGMAKGLGATMLGGSALAAGAGALSARDPQMPQPEPPPQSSGDYPTMMGAGIAAGAPYLKDAVGAGMSALRGLGEPQLPPEPLRASGRDKRRGVPVAQSQTATGAIQQATQQPAQQEQMQAAGNQSGGSGPGYWIDMLQAADTGDAYARDLVALREQARASAIAAAQRGDSQQFVPIMDYRGNKMHFVNAGGGDVVLDMNDEQDRNQYQRIIAKTGLPAEQVQQWASRTSSPLMGYFERGGGPRRPEFDRTPKPAMPQ